MDKLNLQKLKELNNQILSLQMQVSTTSSNKLDAKADILSKESTKINHKNKILK